MSERVRVGVLASGAGTNLEALLRACGRDGFPASVVLVLCNRTGAPALDIARAWGVEAHAMPQREHSNDAAARDRAMVARMRAAGVRLVVCAGYDRLLSDEFLDAFPDAILNVHPSLLPAFGGGMHAVEDALEHGAKVSGCTVQLLEHGEADGGPIVLQAAVPVHEHDDADSLRARIHEQEWILLPRAVELWSSGRLRRDGRRIHIDVEAGPAASGWPPRRRSPELAASGSAPAASPASTAPDAIPRVAPQP
ncbi:MAG: phosphoribosylglycinamide formyltransferase [Candidatus Dormibacteraeota bacterium]|nr:phosphoribosylglycinamide formyltransferase [Candidatus Dormibacteraeota bacterium]MBV9524933.1 phosphoribosylglycinamide formyltransferase [Candidatus Dormibacteraeota bacterium]